ncbi:MAG: DUF4258 domain-containing protein [Bacteroidia bacterium]|nr:DUF4258 domain-containing protein [Bacteroidia bacterium]
MNISKIIKTEHHTRGCVFSIEAENNTIIQILFLHHSLERIEQWEINSEKIIETLIYPEEVMVGHRNRYIAHRRYGSHIVSAVYEYEEEMPVLITVYYPYLEKYYKGGNIYEDKIFKRS